MKETLFIPHEKIIVRTPLYSYGVLFDMNNTTKNLNETIKELLNDTLFLEGIYWSSPALYQNVLEYKRGNYNSAKEDKLLLTLKKYAIRACTRCTPYGIFAGCGITGITERTYNNGEIQQRKARIDMGLLQQIRDTIEADEEIRRYLHYQINDTLYRLPGQYRFIESIADNGKYNYQVSSIEQTEILQIITEVGKNNMLSFDCIYNLLKDEYDNEEIGSFVSNLIDMQFLISELRLSLTVEDELGRFKKILNRIKCHTKNAEKYHELLLNTEHVIQQLNVLPLGQIPVAEMETLRNFLKQCGIAEVPEHLFQVDLLKPAPPAFSFSNQNISELENAITILGKLSASVSSHEQMLRRFKKVFSEKYENSEVSLLEVLDPESGIGFLPAESIGDVAHNSFIGNISAVERSNHSSITPDKADLWLQDKVETVNIIQLQEGIQLTDKDLKDFGDKIHELPNQISVMGTLLPAGKIFLQSVGGANANTLLGRFAYLDEKFTIFSKTLSDEEKKHHDDIAFAEIVHVPEGRTGNIARRIKLCEYEIPILATTACLENTISLNDLVVSVVKDEIVLRSKKLNKRVIPRLNNAHNFHKSMIPVYKFLAAVQHQHKTGFNISFGAWANKKRFLPRISYKNVILHRATWQLQPGDTESIKKDKNPLLKLKEFLSQWHVPQYICIAEADNELFIDTYNDSYTDILLEQVKKHSSLRLVEWLYNGSSDDTPKCPAPYVSQFVLPLSKKNITPITPFRQNTETENKIPRSFAPGSEWLYFKIYCSAFISDAVLSAAVKPAIQSLSEAGIIQKAFFIRYKDPHYHIRFRMLLANADDKHQFTVAVSQVYELLRPFCNDKSVWKIQMDTYEREMGRYGENAIIKSETAFYDDSLLLLNCLEDDNFREDDEIRFLASMKNTDKWLSLFGMDTDAKLKFCSKAADNFALEFNNRLKVQLDIKYRTLKDVIPNFMQSNHFDKCLWERNEQLRKLHLPIENLSSYIHMSQNRWFVNRQRLQEYMAYYFCGRYYNRLLHESERNSIVLA